MLERLLELTCAVLATTVEVTHTQQTLDDRVIMVNKHGPTAHRADKSIQAHTTVREYIDSAATYRMLLKWYSQRTCPFRLA